MRTFSRKEDLVNVLLAIVLHICSKYVHDNQRKRWDQRSPEQAKFPEQKELKTMKQATLDLGHSTELLGFLQSFGAACEH